MKKNALILYVLTSLILIGCYDKINYVNKYNRPICFSFIDNFETKGISIENSNMLKEFCVYAYYTGNGDDNNWMNIGTNALPNFFNAQCVNNIGVNTGVDNWVYSPTLYWPSNENANISFYAYSPIASGISETGNGIEVKNIVGGLTLQYTVPTDCSLQPDLLMAIPQLDLNSNKTDNISISLKHALACIEFSATGSYDTISVIKLKNVCVSGELIYDINGDSLQWKINTDSISSVVAITNNTQLNDNSQSIIASNGYLMMIPQTLGDDSELTIAAKNGNETTFSLSGQKWNAGDKINYQIDIAGNPSDITNTVITNGFVGAFWEYDDTTERIIRMPNDGKWAVSVLCADNQWNTADIMLDTLPASYSRQQGVEISGDAVQMSNTKSILEGDGDIAFRVGLMEYTTLDSENSTPRFAILIVRHTDLTRNHLIYLRQGGIGYPVNGDAAFGVYNISWVPGMELDGVYYTMVNYPSRGGGYKAWSSTDVVYPPLSAKRKYSNGDELNSDYIENVCQDGYDLPSVQDFMDLLQITSGGYSTCCIGGLYADGYFDRGDIVVTTSSGGTTMTVGDDLERGYNGFLVYNNKSYASLFLPTAGCHPEALSTSLNIGTSAYYWSTDLDSLSTNITPYYLFSKQNNSISNLDISIGSDCPKSYALSLRPIYVGD